MDWARILPVVISILVIIIVAVISETSKTVAAVTATMPLMVPLSLWVVYAAENGDAAAMSEYTLGLLIGIIPTLIFIIVAWFLARAEWKLAPVIAVSYVAWGLALGSILGLRRLLG